jgi:membrane-associated phospholipid phosphatase
MNKYFNIKRVKCICVFIFFALTIGLEFLYREKLFNISLKFTKVLQDLGGSKGDIIFKFISEFGSLPIFLPMYLVLLLFYSLTKSYTYITVFTTVSFVTNNMKLYYVSPRPYWIDISLLKACSSGYGNPSGHASESFAVYLTFWKIITTNDYFERKRGLKILLLFIFLIIIGLIILSRVYLASHSINQVLYGSTLGILFYVLFVEVLRMHMIDTKNFFGLLRNVKFIVGILVIHVGLVVLLLITWMFRKVDIESYNSVLKTICPQMSYVNKFNNDALVKGLIISLHIGSHYGLVILSRLMKKLYKGKDQYINDWNNIEWNIRHHLLKFLIITITSIAALLYLLVSSHNTLIIVCLFKMFLPLLLCTFTLHSLGIYLCIRFKLANHKIYELSDETSSTNTDKYALLNIN